MSINELPAYSPSTGQTYDNWAALVDAESNGHIVTVIITNTRTGKSWPWSVGPMPLEEAQRERARLRVKWKREGELYPYLSYRWFVRPVWMPDPRTP